MSQTQYFCDEHLDLVQKSKVLKIPEGCHQIPNQVPVHNDNANEQHVEKDEERMMRVDCMYME